MSTIITCNFNCICVDADCSYKHFISYKERKIVKKFYNTLSNVNKEEPNMETRKKNCTYGQLCNNANCGFKHRLNYENREKLTVLYNYNKICPEKKETKTVENIMVNDKTISTTNYFLTLEDDEIQETIVDIKEQNIKETTDIPKIVEPPPIYNGKSWVDIVINPNDKKINLTIENASWEELADDDFYMKF